MSHGKNISINELVGEIYDLQEQWEDDPVTFNWEKLKETARKGAHAYNEGAGPSFHALVLDGVCHTEFHDRFLRYSIEAGFDPFMLVRTGSGNNASPVISHESLMQASRMNKISDGMRTALVDIARRFSRLKNDINNGSDPGSAHLLAVIQACSDSFPLEMLKDAAEELAKSQR